MNSVDHRRKVRQGTVVSDRMDKTIVVEVVTNRQHPLYKKHLERDSRLHVHDEEERAREGDVVQIRETRPISKTKNWILEDILEKSSARGEEEE